MKIAHKKASGKHQGLSTCNSFFFSPITSISLGNIAQCWESQKKRSNTLQPQEKEYSMEELRPSGHCIVKAVRVTAFVPWGK